MSTNKIFKNTVIVAVVFATLIWPLVQKQFNKSPTPQTEISQVNPSSSSQVLGIEIGNRTKESGCIVNGKLPDRGCTPGDIFPTVTEKDVCISGYSKSVRNVPESEKNQVFAEYGILSHTTGEYEVDHLISLELGGSNDISNLWPEPAEPRPGFHEKDVVENYLHKQVCQGLMALSEAQKIIANDWTKVQIPVK